MDVPARSIKTTDEIFKKQSCTSSVDFVALTDTFPYVYHTLMFMCPIETISIAIIPFQYIHHTAKHIAYCLLDKCQRIHVLAP